MEFLAREMFIPLLYPPKSLAQRFKYISVYIYIYIFSDFSEKYNELFQLTLYSDKKLAFRAMQTHE